SAGLKFPMAACCPMSARKRCGSTASPSGPRKLVFPTRSRPDLASPRITQMKQVFRTLTLVAAALVAGTAIAHHSAVQFDFSKQVSYTGIVKDFAAINPHMRLVVELNDEKGKREVRFEGHSTNNMYRGGYRKGM